MDEVRQRCRVCNGKGWVFAFSYPSSIAQLLLGPRNPVWMKRKCPVCRGEGWMWWIEPEGVLWMDDHHHEEMHDNSLGEIGEYQRLLEDVLLYAKEAQKSLQHTMKGPTLPFALAHVNSIVEEIEEFIEQLHGESQECGGG